MLDAILQRCLVVTRTEERLWTDVIYGYHGVFMNGYLLQRNGERTTFRTTNEDAGELVFLLNVTTVYCSPCLRVSGCGFVRL